ncbi:MAG: methionyl-tRNA formyltransferase [Lachnospiraceae bacterium]|nr:methionyl-tRNA formyltransferase [Lachnospiraceae bacterium]
MKVVFMGTPDFAVSTLEALHKARHEIVLVVTQPDKPRGRGKEMQFPDVKVWAVEHDLPVYQPTKIKEPEAIEYLKAYEADVFVVAAFGQILPKEILDMPRLGCVNVHASLLPKYRGAAPIQWAVINGDEVSGVTTMQMGVGLDDGDILMKKEVKLADDETGGSLFDRLAIVGGELCVETIEALDAGEITPLPQDENQVTHVGMIKKNMGLIDFEKSAVEIERLIRGLNPWPSAFTKLNGKTLKVWKAMVLDSKELDTLKSVTDVKVDSAKPGEVLYAGEDGIAVSCGTDILLMKEIQIEGKKRMAAADYLRGHQVELHTVLGMEK